MFFPISSRTRMRGRERGRKRWQCLLLRRRRRELTLDGRRPPSGLCCFTTTSPRATTSSPRTLPTSRIVESWLRFGGKEVGVRSELWRVGEDQAEPVSFPDQAKSKSHSNFRPGLETNRIKPPWPKKINSMVSAITSSLAACTDRRCLPPDHAWVKTTIFSVYLYTPKKTKEAKKIRRGTSARSVC